MACIASFLSSCFGEQPEKDKYPHIREFSEITTPEYTITKTPYSGFGTTQYFHFTIEQNKEPISKNLVLLNKEFEVLKKLKLQSKDSRFAIFGELIFIIEDSNSSNSLIKTTYPAFDMDSIELMAKAQIILDSIKNSVPDSLLRLNGNQTNQYIDSLYCNSMIDQLSKDLKEVYQMDYPAGGKYFVLDYGDKMFYYKDNRSFYPKICWSDLQKKEQINFTKKNRIIPFYKAFTEWTRNRTLGGKQKSGYQYFKLKTQNREIKFKKKLGQYFDPSSKFLEVYTSINNDSLLLQECSWDNINALYWIIEQTE